MGGSLRSWSFDNFHTVALGCREREPSTPSALGPFADALAQDPAAEFDP